MRINVNVGQAVVLVVLPPQNNNNVLPLFMFTNNQLQGLNESPEQDSVCKLSHESNQDSLCNEEYRLSLLNVSLHSL